MLLYPYTPPSFLTPMGSLGKARQLKAKGFPENLRNWRFLTLSINRDNYSCPFEAYEIGTRHLRQFIYDLRELGFNIPRYCWKLEFHKPDEDGEIWPHWHMLLDYKRPIPADLINGCWGKGRTEIKGVRDKGFDYMFKYMSKELDELPDWVLEMKRLRCFQSSVGFFPPAPQKISVSDGVEKIEDASPRESGDRCARDTQNNALRNQTIGERLERHQHTVVSRIQCDDLSYRHTLHINPHPTWGALLVSVSRIKLSGKLDQNTLSITSSNRIETTCLHYLPPTFQTASG